jgi:hypothetical protein
MIESPSEEEHEKEYDEEEMALFIKNFNKFIRKRRSFKRDRKRSQDKKGCATIMARVGISLPNVLMRGKKKAMTFISLQPQLQI